MIDGEMVAVGGKVFMQKCDTTGSYTTSVAWTPAKGGWCIAGKKCGTDIEAVTLKDGEGVCINSKYATAAQFQVSGEVNLTPTTGFLKKGYNLVGNMTPVTMDLQQIVPYVGNEPVSVGGKVFMQKCGTDGSYLESYAWTPAKGGWCIAGKLLTGETAVTFAPGEAACVNNKADDVLELHFASPVK